MILRTDRCVLAVFWLLVTSACGGSACDRYADAYCKASHMSCEATRVLFRRAELPTEVCVEGVQAVADFSRLGEDVRGMALAALLRDTMKKSPKLTPAEVDAVSPPMPSRDREAGPVDDSAVREQLGREAERGEPGAER